MPGRKGRPSGRTPEDLGCFAIYRAKGCRTADGRAMADRPGV